MKIYEAWVQKIFFCILFICCFWILGFGLFIYEIDSIKPSRDYADTIIIFSGSHNRPLFYHNNMKHNLQSVESVKIVSPHYQMPRRLLEISYLFPKINFVPYPVLSPSFQRAFWWINLHNIHMLFLEYNKYLMTQIFYTAKVG